MLQPNTAKQHLQVAISHQHDIDQRGPNTGPRAACGPRTISVCRILQSHTYIVLATQPLQVTHHRSASQYITNRG